MRHGFEPDIRILYEVQSPVAQILSGIIRHFPEDNRDNRFIHGIDKGHV